MALLELARALEDGRVTAEATARACLERIAALDPGLGAFVRVTSEAALEAARASDARRARGAALGPLDGVPVAVKDLFCTQGVETGAGSRVLAGWVPPYDATVVARLKAAGAVLLGKTNLDEFGMGSATVFSAHGPTRNPWDPARTAGGSSGGSAAAVAARLCSAALGTDTGGSVRQPAALTGVAGLKPTYGRLSRHGVIAFASSLDCPGLFATCAADLRVLLQALAGPDPRDATSARRPPPDDAAFRAPDLRGLRLGLPREYFGPGLEPEVEAAVRAAAAWFEAAGARVEQVSLPHTDAAMAAYYVIAPAEAASNLARYDGVRYGPRTEGETLEAMYRRTRTDGFGPEARRRILLGTFVLSEGYREAYHGRATRVRAQVAADFRAALGRVDVLLTPTSPTTAWPLDARRDDPVQMYRSDVYTVPASLAGVPALSIPGGFDGRGLPIGLQLVGRPFDEAGLIALGTAYETAHGFHLRAPPVGGLP